LQFAKSLEVDKTINHVSISKTTQILPWLTEYNVACGVKPLRVTGQEYRMAYSPDHDHSHHAGIPRPDPFASLTAHDTRRRRFWLFELLMGPFQDHDERASYTIAGKESEAKVAAGIRANKAWNGNGAPAPNPMPWNGGGNGQTAPIPGVAAPGVRFSPAGRQPAGR
jgi:hypothetical protein